MTLTWNETEEGPAERTYEVSWSSDQNGVFSRNVTSAQITINDLVSNTNYTFTVAEVNGDRAGARSEARSYLTREFIRVV